MKNTFVLLYLFTFFLVLTQITPASAQNIPLAISGKIVSSETDQPISFASISIGNSGMGTSSNAGGIFTIKIPAAFKQDTLRVTYVGYTAFKQAILGIKDQTLIIKLKSATVALAEIIVSGKRKTAVDILRDAIAAIPVNYDTTSVQLTAFYREDVKLEDYPIAYNESVLDVRKPPYHTLTG